MKKLITILFVLFPVFALGENQGYLQFKNQNLNSHVLAELLNWGELKFKIFTPPRYSIKIYSLQQDGNCYKESHGICSHKYYLAYSEFGEDPRQSVFYLGNIGEIIEFEHLKPDGVMNVRIGLKIVNFAKVALEYGSDLKRIEKDVIIQVSVKKITVISDH